MRLASLSVEFKTMNDYDKVVLFIGFISYIAAILQGVVTFGDAIVIHLAWRVAVLVAPTVMMSTPYGTNHLVAVSLTLSVRALFVQPVFCWRSREYLNWPLLKVMLPIQLVMIVLGAIVLERFHNTSWLGPLLGVSLGVFAIGFGVVSARQLVKNRQMGIVVHKSHHDFVITRSHQWWMAIASIVSGVMSGIVGIGGPALMVAAVVNDMPQPVLRGAFPFCWAASFVVRDAWSLANGEYLFDAWMLFAAAGIGSIAGLLWGIEIGARLPHDIFIFSACWIMFFGGVSLADLSGVWILITMACCFLSFAALRMLGPAASKPTGIAPIAPQVIEEAVSHGEAPQIEIIDDILEEQTHGH
jgi:uncharacterized membrane protein YfcA